MTRLQVSNVVSKAKRGRRGRANGRRNKGRRMVEEYAGDAYDLARRTWKGLNAVRRLINIEEKFYVSDLSVSAVQTPTITHVSGIAQGTDISGRIGDSIKIQHLTLRGRIAVNAAVTTWSSYRLLLLRDMSCSGVAPSATDIFQAVATTVTTRSCINYINRQRFGLLLDEYGTVDPGSNKCDTFLFDIPLDKHVFYKGSTNTVSDADRGSLFLVAVSDEPTNGVDIKAYLSFTYTDD